MKKILSVVIVCALLASFAAVSASASSFDGWADDLNSLGLFLGSDDGYELDRAPRRAEAAVMLIRLLGKEDAALDGEFEHPFTDAGWADQYVGYMYENGLTNGISATEFGTNNLCDMRMYTVFVLRALGYTEAAGDFTYENALAFGTQLGIVDPLIADGSFLRDDMVAVSYLGLMAQPKDKSADSLLQKLVDEGVVAAADAKPILDRFAVYKEYIAAVSGYIDAEKIDVDVDLVMDMTVMGQAVSVVSDLNMKLIMDGNNPLLSSVGTMDVMGDLMDMEMYYKDGYMYVNMGGEKMKMAMDMETAIAEMGYQSVDGESLYLIEDIKKTVEGGQTVYTIDYSASVLSDMVEAAMDNVKELLVGLDQEINMTFDINRLVYKILVDKNGLLTGMQMSMDVDVDIIMDGIEVPVTYEYAIDMKILAVGDSVKITLPSDLDTYTLTAA